MVGYQVLIGAANLDSRPDELYVGSLVPGLGVLVQGIAEYTLVGLSDSVGDDVYALNGSTPSIHHDMLRPTYPQPTWSNCIVESMDSVAVYCT
jgi:hypothetical protein